MILVLAGTIDGRNLAGRLAALGYRTIVSVVSRYGESLLDSQNVNIHSGRLSAAGMADLICSENIGLLVDASHPYAAVASENALEACEKTGISYLRYERPRSLLPDYQKFYLVKDMAEAAKTAAKLGRVIFLTTGSRDLKKFMAEPEIVDSRVIARVLPQTEILAECLEMGFTPKDIIAMQGPFSKELNVALFKEFGAQVLVTKNSGREGGTEAKIDAAVELDLPLVIIGRPAVFYKNICCSEQEVIDFCQKNFSEA